jgi:putative exosortase-associated protein (TIGR04073 family)
MIRSIVAIGTAFCIVFFAATPFSFAGEANWGTKLGNGLTNVLTSWMEVPKQIKDVSQENDDPIAGITYGTAKGIGLTAARIIVGVFDVITCPLAPFDEPMMEPLFTWGE